MDISKVFDKVWHEGLLNKLESMGISGNLLNLFRSFLNHRCQRVVINSQHSEWVPQGSILGPLLFLIYINDLPDNLNSLVKLFADDTSLFSTVHDPTLSAKILNDTLSRISEWAHRCKILFNPDITKQAQEVIFSRKKIPKMTTILFISMKPQLRILLVKNI